MRKHILYPMILLNTLCLGSDAQPSTQVMPDSNQMPIVPRYNNNVFIDADFLYWYSKQEGNNYAATGSAITVPGTTDPNTTLVPGPVGSGKVYSPNPKAEPGFKVGLGIICRLHICPWRSKRFCRF